jgi:transcriptional regulator with XRE-family HTH domain
MVKLGLKQADVALVLDVSQVSVSDRLRGITKISFEEAALLDEKYQLRTEYLMSGTGPMFPSPDASEPAISYSSLQVDTSDNGIRERFVQEVKVYSDRQEMLSREVAGRLHISESQWTQIKRGEKNVTAPILAHGVLNLDVDANWVCAQIETKPSRIKAMLEHCKKMEDDNENMRLLLKSLKEKLGEQETQSKKKSA